MRFLVRILTRGALGLVIVLVWVSRPIDPAPPLTLTAPAGEGPAPAVTAETTLRRRETLEAALVRSGLERADAAVVIGLLRGAVDMRRLAPGERLVVRRDAADSIMGITYWRSPIERYELSRAEGGWST